MSYSPWLLTWSLIKFLSLLWFPREHGLGLPMNSSVISGLSIRLTCSATFHLACFLKIHHDPSWFYAFLSLSSWHVVLHKFKRATLFSPLIPKHFKLLYIQMNFRQLVFNFAYFLFSISLVRWFGALLLNSNRTWNQNDRPSWSCLLVLSSEIAT